MSNSSDQSVSLLGFVRDLNSMEVEIRALSPIAANHLLGTPRAKLCLSTLEGAARADPRNPGLREIAAKLVALAIANGLWDPVQPYSSCVANALAPDALKRRTRDVFRDEEGAIQRRSHLLEHWRKVPREWRNIRHDELTQLNAPASLELLCRSIDGSAAPQ